MVIALLATLLLAARGEAAWGASEGADRSRGEGDTAGSAQPGDVSSSGGKEGGKEAGKESTTDGAKEGSGSRGGLSLPSGHNPFAAPSGQANDEPAADADADSAVGEDAPGAPLRALSCLEGEGGEEGDGARRGVQKRDFQKRHRFELGLIGGYVAMDALSSTYITGGTLAFYPSEDFGVEVLVSRAPVQYRLESAFSSFDFERRFTSGVAWQGLASALFSPFHAKFRFTDKSIWHADLFLLGGAGRTWHESVQGITTELGVGLKLYPWRFVSIRLDVRDFVYAQEVLGRASTTHNIAVMAGLSIWGPG